MTSLDLIKQYLPEELRNKAQQFTISDEFFAKNSALIVLILNSKSLEKDEEKQSWFNLFPLMNDEQITKLNDILIREKQKLEEIEAKYAEKKQEIKDKYVQRREAMGYQNKMGQLKAVESEHQVKEQQEADALLNQL